MTWPLASASDSDPDSLTAAQAILKLTGWPGGIGTFQTRSTGSKAIGNVRRCSKQAAIADSHHLGPGSWKVTRTVRFPATSGGVRQRRNLMVIRQAHVLLPRDNSQEELPYGDS